jgi:enoyl-CoA hydratase/carnithine racemase
MRVDELVREDRDGAARLWLKRPGKRNAISEALYVALRDSLRAIAGDDRARFVVFRSAVPGVFSAGADIATMADPRPVELQRQFELLIECIDAFRSCPKPVLTIVDGDCLGVGCAIAAASDVVVARSDVQFALPEIRLGLAPVLAMAALAPVVRERQLVLWAATGRHFPADEAHAAGLVTSVVQAGALDAFVTELENELRRADGVALAQIKSTARMLYGVSTDAPDRLMQDMLATATAPAARAAIESFLQRKRRT